MEPYDIIFKLTPYSIMWESVWYEMLQMPPRNHRNGQVWTA